MEFDAGARWPTTPKLELAVLADGRLPSLPEPANSSPEDAKGIPESAGRLELVCSNLCVATAVQHGTKVDPSGGESGTTPSAYGHESNFKRQVPTFALAAALMYPWYSAIYSRRDWIR
jgi:hypothetical protein